MEYFLIKGHFHVVGYAPDGDSLMFEADDPKNWDKVLTQHRDIFEDKLKLGKNVVQLRLQGIDALETHYPTPFHPTPKGMRGKKYAKAIPPEKNKMYHQPEEYAEKATAKLLDYLNVEEFKWGRRAITSVSVKIGKKTETFKKKNQDKIPGYIITNDMDRKGRPISWVYGGGTRSKDGTRFTTSQMVSKVKKSCNYRLVATGMAYPYFFMTLAAKLRQKIIDGYKNAKRQEYGIWKEDRTMDGIPLTKRSELFKEYIIFPYLFRRIIKHQVRIQNEEYYEAVKNKKSFKPDTDEMFLDRFFEQTNPYVFLIKEKDFVRLDRIVKPSEKGFKLLTDPGNIVFLS